MSRNLTVASLVALGLGFGAVANAHHAVQAQFDVTKNVIVEGVLKKVDWQNPHAWFHFDVKKEDGSTVVWSFETVGPNGLRRLGISDRRLFKIGDSYKIDMHPDRSGKNLGFVNSFTFPDGKFIKVGFPDEEGGEPPR
jgi:Family of unknown function (DUF6152)